MNTDRRGFLKGAGVLGGAVLLGSALDGCSWFPPGPGPEDSLLDWSAPLCPVDHVVVVMMENRSFDHWLGWMATDEGYLEAGRSRYGAGFGVNGAQHQDYLGPSGEVPTEHLVGDPDQSNPYRGCGFGDPGHSWGAGRAQRDGGFLAPGSNNDEFALGYYLGDDLPFTANLAKRFTTLDNSHASVLGPTYPNREYLHSAQSGGNKGNAFPDTLDGFQWETIWDRLAKAFVPARYYFSDLPMLGLWGARTLPFLNGIDRYYEDCATGNLPAVSFVEPTFLGDGQEDDHPLADVRAGQDFLRRVFKAFAQSTHWERGLFVVTYDEWGGFFDHVAPPVLPDDRASSVDSENFGQAGFRVPTVVASPFCRPGSVDHRLYDHTSVLRFLEWRFLGAPPEGPGGADASWFLTARDRYANNLGASLSAQLVDADLHFDIDGLGIGTPSGACATGGATAADGAEASPAPDLGPSTFQQAYDSGWFQRAGIPIRGH